MRTTRRKRTKPVRGLPFVLGFDPRRHLFTDDERRRGGFARWAAEMRQWYAASSGDYPRCPRCGGPAIAELFNFRCTKCGFTWCEGCGRRKDGEQ